MKKLLLILVVLFLAAGSAIAAPVPIVHWVMTSVDDFNTGEVVEPFGGHASRTYVTNAANGNIISGMTHPSQSGLHPNAENRFDPDENAYHFAAHRYCGITGTSGELDLFTSTTQYSFSLWAKSAGIRDGNGWHMLLQFADDQIFRMQLGFKENQRPELIAPGATHWHYRPGTIWDSEDGDYIDPATWNMYSWTWNADTGYVASYVNGVLAGSWDYGEGVLPEVTGLIGFELGNRLYESSHQPRSWVRDFMIFDTALTDQEVMALVPEPTTIALLGLGGLALVRRKRS